MLRKSRIQVKRLAAAAQPYAEEVVADEKLRGHALAAAGSAVRVFNRVAASMGIAGLAWRLFNDQNLQAELRRVTAELGELGKRGERARARRRRRQRLIVGGVGLGGIALAAAVTSALRRSAAAEQSIEVGVPVTTAYNQWTQFEEFPAFMESVDRVEQLDDTHLHWVTSFGGRRHEFDAEITEQRPNERVEWKTTAGKQHAGVVSFDRVDGGRTRIAVRMTWEPEDLYERLGGALGVDRRRVKGDLQRFKQLIESRGVESGAWRGEVEESEVVRS